MAFGHEGEQPRSFDLWQAHRKVREVHIRRSREAIPHIPISDAQYWGINGEDQGRVARLSGPSHEILGDRSIPMDVELEPPCTVGCGSSDDFQRR
jgi:hypothetical protein